MGFLDGFFGVSRKFASYDDCPGLHYRFNGKGDYGPQKLDVALGYFAGRERDVIECRFSDEGTWRPLKYYSDLWASMPPSGHSLARLKSEGIVLEAGLSEPKARALIRDRQKLKPVTAAQRKKLEAAGEVIGEDIDRAQAATLARGIRESEQKRTEEVKMAAKELADAEKMPEAIARLDSTVAKVRLLIADWQPKESIGLDGLEEQIRQVDEALDYALRFTGQGLNSDVFNDPSKQNIGYYLDFKGAVNSTELTIFRAAMFEGYLSKDGDQFDHLGPLKKSFSNLTVEKL